MCSPYMASGVTIGRLDIDNSIDTRKGWWSGGVGFVLLKFDLYPDIKDGLDEYDEVWNSSYLPPLPPGERWIPMVVSIVEEHELEADFRPARSTSVVQLKLSIVVPGGGSVDMSGNGNKVRFEWFNWRGGGWDYDNDQFGSQIITVYGPDGSSYDLRNLIRFNGGILELPNLSGTYNSEEPYATITITFEYPPAPPPIKSPQVDTLSASNITQTSAKLEAKLIEDGGESCQWRLGYGKGAEPNDAWTWTGWNCCATDGETFNANISNLTPLTKYFVTSEAKNSAGTTRGDKETFTTLAIPIAAPTLDTLSASNITQTSAKLEAKLIDDGNEPSSWRLGYGKGSEPNEAWTWTAWNCCATDGQTFNANISNLTPLTKYFVTSEAKNWAGTSQGDIENFTTLTPPKIAGVLRIEYQVNALSNESNQYCTIIHISGSSESSDSNDIVYTNTTRPIIPKIVTILPGLKDKYELTTDARPQDSLSDIYLQLSLDSNSPVPVQLSSARSLKLSFLSEDTFGDEPILMQQYDPTNPAAEFPIYNIRNVIDKNSGEIPLADLAGDYTPGRIDSYWKLSFEINSSNMLGDLNHDGTIDLKDFAILALLMGQTNVYSSADLASAKGAGIPDFKIDKNDLLAFSQKFLTETNKEPQPSPIYAFEGFETGVLNENFKTYGNTPWFIVQEPYSGKHSIRAGAITHGQTSSLEITANCKAGYVSFYRKVSSRKGSLNDCFKVYIDNQLKNRDRGERDWGFLRLSVLNGDHTLRVEYLENETARVEQYTVFIDNLELPLAE